MRNIGKFCARIIAVEIEDGIKFNAEFDELPEERKRVITDAMVDGDSHGYNLRTVKHRYFLLENFMKLIFRG